MMIEAALRSLLLALAVWIGLRAFRVRNVVAQKAAWGLVLAAALLMPILAPTLARVLPANASVILSLRPFSQSARIEPALPPAARETAPTLQEVDVASAAVLSKPSPVHSSPAHPAHSSKRRLNRESDAVLLDTPEAGATSVYTGASASSIPIQPARPHAPIALSTLLWTLYFGVGAALLLRLFYGLASALSLLSSAAPVSPGECPGVRVCTSRRVSSPVTIGSTVVLPADYVEWDAEKLRIVLAHERSHIRQGDFYLQFLAGLYAALVWFSPLGWWLKRELSDLAETISDRAGLGQAASTTAYAQILLEFAAAPRPAILGVAMARTGSLSRRIERLLNDHAFRQAFAGGRRRALIAVLLVPAALFAATALVRVQAAQDAQAAPAATPAAAAQPAPAAQIAEPARGSADPQPDAEPHVEVQTNGAIAPELAGPVVAPAAPQAPPAPAAVGITAIPPGAPMNPIGPATPIGPMAPVGPVGPVGPRSPLVRVRPGEIRLYAMAQDDASKASRHGYRYRYSIDGDSYAIIRGDGGENMTFSGEMHTGDIDKARKLAHGDFLWFERDDKQYYVDDPATIAQIEAMYKPIDELGKQQEALGKQQEELGRQQEALGRQQEEATVPAPDLQKEMAEIDAAMAKLKAKMGQNITQDELGDLQNRLGDLQGKLGDLQGKIGEEQGELGAQQGRLGAQQGKLGAEQGRLGAEQGRLSMEADRKVHSIIDESLQNGKAHLVH